MNTQLPAKTQSSAKSDLFATPQKAPPSAKNLQSKSLKKSTNLSLRYPKELEHCFVLGNN